MTFQLRTLLFGKTHSTKRRYTPIVLAIILFTMTFLLYAFDVFELSGGLIFLAFHAAVMGMCGAIWVGYSQHGLVAAWTITYAALLGQSANFYFLSQPPNQSLTDRAAEFIQPDGIVLLGIEALVLGTVAFFFGALCGFGKSVIEHHRSSSSRN